MKITIKKDGNEISIECGTVYFKELLELIAHCANSISVIKSQRHE
jgi:hypothetical protein